MILINDLHQYKTWTNCDLPINLGNEVIMKELLDHLKLFTKNSQEILKRW